MCNLFYVIILTLIPAIAIVLLKIAPLLFVLFVAYAMIASLFSPTRKSDGWGNTKGGHGLVSGIIIGLILGAMGFPFGDE